MRSLDLLIVGGGPAGMAAALVAGRARLRTVVVNSEKPRNAASHASHGFLTRDGAHASELLAIAKSQLGKYPSVDYFVGSVANVRRDDDAFIVDGGEGEQWRALRVVFATGYRTELSTVELPGIEEVYGRSVFPCPFCDGFEHADEKLAVFTWEVVEHMAPLVKLWSSDVVVFTHGRRVEEATRKMLAERGIGLHEQRVRALEHRDGKLSAVLLEDGERVPREAGFLGHEHAVPATELPGALGVSVGENMWGMKHYAADDMGKTDQPGVYVVGDLKRVFGGITGAAHDGYNCAVGIAHEVAMEHPRQ